MPASDRPVDDVIAEISELRQRLTAWQREADEELRRRDKFVARQEQKLAQCEQELATAQMAEQTARQDEAEARKELQALRASTTFRLARVLARTADRVKALRR